MAVFAEEILQGKASELRICRFVGEIDVKLEGCNTAEVQTVVLIGGINVEKIKVAEQPEQAIESLTAYNDVGFVEKPVYEVCKRVFDVVFSLLALIVLSPILLIVAVAIMIDDFGSPFFVQERTGKNSKPFKMYKFRSMRFNAEKELDNLMKFNEYADIHFKMENDPRITKVGKFIRKTSIDELPQLINIIKGDMSIIGPRPFVPAEQEQLPADRLRVKPGLSCYWQISDTAKMSNDEQLELDYKYIRERSALTDIKIIFLTVGIVFGKKNR